MYAQKMFDAALSQAQYDSREAEKPRSFMLFRFRFVRDLYAANLKPDEKDVQLAYVMYSELFYFLSDNREKFLSSLYLKASACYANENR